MCVMLSATIAQVSTWDGTHTTWTNGNGTEANPYLIENAQQLAHLAYEVNVPAASRGGGNEAFSTRATAAKIAKYLSTRGNADILRHRSLVAGGFHAGYILLFSVVLSAKPRH